MDVEQYSMKLILHAGNAKNYMYEALEHARETSFDQVEGKLKLADSELLQAHQIQTSFIQEDAKEQIGSYPVILVHAQDHLMTVMAEKNLIGELIMMYEKQHEIERKLDGVVEKVVEMQKEEKIN